MLIKRGNAEIMDVMGDDEHNLDDEGTRKALAKAEKEEKKTAESKPAENPNSLVN